MRPARATLIWSGLVAAVSIPIAAAAFSPLLAWRDPVYIAAGFAGIVALCLMLLQPLLATGYLPSLSTYRGRRIHRWTGGLLVALVVVHVAALWLTSPPDVVDALLFRSPTPFAAWGVIAMWALFATALLAAFRRRFVERLRVWRMAHTSLAVVIVVGTVVHVVLIEGTMETVSKILLCAFVLAATVKAVVDLRVWAKRKPSSRHIS